MTTFFNNQLSQKGIPPFGYRLCNNVPTTVETTQTIPYSPAGNLKSSSQGIKGISELNTADDITSQRMPDGWR